MKPYLAVVKDSFREALRSPVLWIFVFLLTLLLAGFAPIRAVEQLNTRLSTEDVNNWPEFAQRLDKAYRGLAPSPGKRLWGRFDESLRERMLKLEPPKQGDLQSLTDFVKTLEDFNKQLNDAISSDDLYDETAWSNVVLGAEAKELEKKGIDKLTDSERQRFHRLAVEAAFPDLIRSRPRTSYAFSYGPWDLATVPLKPEDFRSYLGAGVAYMSDWVVGLGLIVIAVLVTAPVIPRMFDQGQLHLLLSKPVRRSTLLLFQFVGSCVFVLLLTTYFVLGLWFILGARCNYWDVRLFWMVPVYVFMFAIYYTVSAAAAVFWRNTLMAVISSVMFFIACFLLGVSIWWYDATIMRPQRLVKIVPAGNALLAVNESGIVQAWNAEKKAWDTAFLPKELEALGNFTTFMGANVFSIGPVYLPERESIAAVQFSLAGGQGPVNVMRQVVAVGRPEGGWKNLEGAPAPMGSFSVFSEPAGGLLVVSNLGVFRMTGDPAKKPLQPKILGFDLPLPSPSAFVNVGPDDGLVFGPPAIAAYHAPSHQLAVCAQGKLTVLKADKNRKYQIVAQRQLDDAATESVALALNADVVLVGRASGVVQVLKTSNLEDRSEFRPEETSAARAIAASSLSSLLAVTCHNGALWMYDSASDEWHAARVRGRGDVSAAVFDNRGRLLVAEHTNRITSYDPETLAVEERYAPNLDALQRIYYYGLQPAYTIFPKPGEFFKTMRYLLTGKETVATNNGAGGQRQLNPWAPVWSGLGFMVVVLGITCVYFERQEY